MPKGRKAGAADPDKTRSLSCLIEVDGKDRGKRGNGRPEKTLARPVREFLRSSDYYYKAVLNHIRGCGRCDPAEALQGFIDNREERCDGLVSGTLVEMAERYWKLFPGRVPEALIAEFVVRSLDMDVESYLVRARRLSMGEEDVARSVALLEGSWRKSVSGTLSKVRGAKRVTEWILYNAEMVLKRTPASRVRTALLAPTPRASLALEGSGRLGERLREEVMRYGPGWPAAHGGREWEELRALVDVHSVMRS